MLTVHATASPYVPESRDDVLIKLPKSMIGIRDKDAEPEGGAQAENRLTYRLQKAKKYLSAAKVENEPSWYGYAHAMLVPWWNDSEHYPEVALYKAMIFQQQHRFPEALIELDYVLRQQPRLVQGLLIRASVYMMQARFAEAQQDCQKLFWLSSPAVGMNCVSQINGLTGKGRSAINQLLSMIDVQGGAEDSMVAETTLKQLELSTLELSEIYTTIATIAHRYNLAGLAQTYYQKAFLITPESSYLVEQYTDFLVENKQTEQMVQLFNELSRDDLDQKIKRVGYLQQLNSPDAEVTIRELVNYFKDAKVRKEQFPHKEFSKFSLTVSHNYQDALSSALTNWAIQQAPSDALLVLKSALANQTAQYAEPVIQWVETTGLYDYRIEGLIADLESQRVSL